MEERLANCRFETPEALGLLERQLQARHFQVFMLNAAQQLGNRLSLELFHRVASQGSHVETHNLALNLIPSIG